MDILLELWSNLQWAAGIVLYFSIIVLLVMLERHFIQKRSKGEFLLPVAAFLVAAVLAAATFHAGYGTGSGLGQIQVSEGNRQVGRLAIVYDKDGDLKAVGQYIRGDDEKIEFIDLQLKNGKVTSSSKPLTSMEKKDMEESLSYRSGKHFSGASMTYEELIPIGEKYEFYEEKVTWHSFFGGMVYYSPAAFIVFFMYLEACGKRKYRRWKNAVIKSKLEDL